MVYQVYLYKKWCNRSGFLIQISLKFNCDELIDNKFKKLFHFHNDTLVRQIF